MQIISLQFRSLKRKSQKERLYEKKRKTFLSQKRTGKTTGHGNTRKKEYTHGNFINKSKNFISRVDS